MTKTCLKNSPKETYTETVK